MTILLHSYFVDFVVNDVHLNVFADDILCIHWEGILRVFGNSARNHFSISFCDDSSDRNWSIQARTLDIKINIYGIWTNHLDLYIARVAACSYDSTNSKFKVVQALIPAICNNYGFRII